MKDTDREYLFNQHKVTQNSIEFYNSIVHSYESSGQDINLQELKDQLDNFIPPETDNIMQSFKLTLTQIEIILHSMSLLPKKFQKLYTDAEKKHLTIEILFRDKNKQFEFLLAKMNDGIKRSFDKWVKQFENLLTGYKMDEKLRSKSIISTATTKSENIKSETSTSPVALVASSEPSTENDKEILTKQ